MDFFCAISTEFFRLQMKITKRGDSENVTSIRAQESLIPLGLQV